MYRKFGFDLFAVASFLAVTIPAYSQGPMPPCASQAIFAAEHLAGEDFKDLNNEYLGTDDDFVVWQVELGDRSSVKTYRIEASVPDCRIEDVFDISQSGGNSGQDPNANCGIAINGHSCI